MEEALGIQARDAQRLATAILTMAVKEWKVVRKRPSSLECRMLVSFFMSDWFSDLCCIAAVNDEWLLNMLHIPWRYLPGKM